MSNTKQLPADLVEKMRNPINGLFEESNLTLQQSSEQCAQIAVDYAEEENRELREFVKFIDDNWDDFLKHTNLAKSFHTGKNFQFMNELPFKAKQLLNK